MRHAVIVSGVRTAVGKAPRGKLRTTRPDDMAGVVVSEAFQRAGGLTPEDVDDVIIGCAMPEGEQGLNMGRIAAIRAGLPNAVTGHDRQSFLRLGRANRSRSPRSKFARVGAIASSRAARKA